MRKGTVRPNKKRFLELREQRGWSQAALAEEVGCGKKTVERIENGEAAFLNSIAEFATAFGVTVAELIDSPGLISNDDLRPRQESALAAKRFRIRGLAPALGRRLVGREHDIENIKRTIRNASEGQSVGVVAVQGVPGVGKSSLLSHLALDDSLAEQFPDGGFWAGVGESPDISQLLRSWAQALKVTEGNLVRIEDLVGALRAKLQGRRVLLLVDDVWHDHHAESFRVASRPSVVLYATRLPDLAERLAPAPGSIYALRGLNKEDAIRLLATIAPDVVREHSSLCDDLVGDVDGLPLAVLVAGRMLHREHSSNGDVGKLLRAMRNDARMLLSQPVPPDMTDLLNQTTPNVAAVLRRSTGVLDEQHRWYFARLGAFAAAPATFDLKFAGRCWKISPDEARRVAKHFLDLGLIEAPKRGQFQIHPLMKALALHEWDLIND